jgi:2,4-diketo-3-deoxy-L-fuconate hydrolase
MRICRFTLKSGPEPQPPRLGVMDESGIRDVTAAADLLPAQRWPLSPGDQFIGSLGSLRARIEELAAKAPVIAPASVRLLSPVANPGKFICGVGNWSHHKAPLGLLGFLFKASSALAGAGEGVQIRWPDRTTLHEPELAIVIGKQCTNVIEAEALDCVAGYCCALDMTMK